MDAGVQAQQASCRLDEYGTRTLVVGALGVIGRNVVEHLADSGRSVVGSADGSHRWPRTTAPNM